MESGVKYLNPQESCQEYDPKIWRIFGGSLFETLSCLGGGQYLFSTFFLGGGGQNAKCYFFMERGSDMIKSCS